MLFEAERVVDATCVHPSASVMPNSCASCRPELRAVGQGFSPGRTRAPPQVFNLVLAARATHQWYLSTFPTYPKARRALIPFLL